MSRLEILGMAEELGLQVDSCTFWWLRLKGNGMGLTEIKYNVDALEMASNVPHNKLITIYAKVSNIGANNSSELVSGKECDGVHCMQIGEGENNQELVMEENIDLQDASIGQHEKK